MNTRKVKVSVMVTVDGQVVFKDLLIDWIASDDAGAIAEDINDAILNIE